VNASVPHVRLVTLGGNPLPDIPAADHPAAMELVEVARQFRDDDHVGDIAEFHNAQNLGGKFDDATVRRLVAYALNVEQPIEPKPSRFVLHSIPELMARAYPTWTVREVMPATGLAVIYGGPGSGKTFLMLDMAMAIARGIKWHGRRTKQGVCVYIAGEGALRARVAAYLKHNNLSEDDIPDFITLESAVNLLDARADVADLIESIRAKVGERRVRMIVVDTLARTMPGGNENASEDMGAVIGSAGKVASAFECLFGFVHHSGKDDAKGSRGHSSLKGACDVEISVKREGDVREVIAEKVRDGPDQETLLTFRLQSIDLGAVSDYDDEAEEWERITSCVVATDNLPARQRPGPSTKNQASALAAIRTALANSGKRALTQDEALRAVRQGTDMPRNRAHEAIEGLIKNCYLKSSAMGGIEVITDE